MNSGRKTNPPPAQAANALDADAVARKSAALTVLGTRSAEVAELYGDGLPYDRSRIVHEARFYMAQSAEAMLEAGKRLIQIKENELHGDFLEIVTEQLGIGERSARLMMQAAIKYLSPALESKRQTFAVLGRSKLFDLMAESDGDLGELAEGGTVAGLKLDDMQAMSARELRAALVEDRKRLAAKDAVIAKKDQKLNALTEAEERRLSANPNEREQALLNDVRDAALAAEMAIRKLVRVAAVGVDAPPTEAAGTAALQAAQFVAVLFGSLLSEAGIPVDLDEAITPHWLKDVPKAGDKPAAA